MDGRVGASCSDDHMVMNPWIWCVLVVLTVLTVRATSGRGSAAEYIIKDDESPRRTTVILANAKSWWKTIDFSALAGMLTVALKGDPDEFWPSRVLKLYRFTCLV